MCHKELTDVLVAEPSTLLIGAVEAALLKEVYLPPISGSLPTTFYFKYFFYCCHILFSFRSFYLHPLALTGRALGTRASPSALAVGDLMTGVVLFSVWEGCTLILSYGRTARTDRPPPRL